MVDLINPIGWWTGMYQISTKFDCLTSLIVGHVCMCVNSNSESASKYFCKEFMYRATKMYSLDQNKAYSTLAILLAHLTAILVDCFTAALLEIQDLLESSLVLGRAVVRSSLHCDH